MSENQCEVSPGLRSYANRIAFEVAEAHGVSIVELATAPLHKSRLVSKAREELCVRLRVEIRYRIGELDPFTLAARTCSELGITLAELISGEASEAVANARRDLVELLREHALRMDPPFHLKTGGVNRWREYRLADEIPHGERSEWSQLSYPDIARCLGANHSTILLALRRAAENGNGEPTHA